jgi:hypothetical protein
MILVPNGHHGDPTDTDPAAASLEARFVHFLTKAGLDPMRRERCRRVPTGAVGGRGTSPVSALC